MLRVRPAARWLLAGLALVTNACSDSTPTGPAPSGRVETVAVVPATTFLQPGQTRQLVLDVRDATGAAVVGYTATWRSDNAAVASVSAGGVVTAIGRGTTRITATVNGVRAEAQVGVTAAASGANTWRVQRIGDEDASLLAIWDDGAGTAWAGGTNGMLLKSVSGGAWVREPITATETIVGIWGARPNDAWAVGSGGLLLRYDGTQWRRQTSFTTRTLLSIWGLGANDIYATGDNGLIARWDGALWSVQGTATSNEIWGVHGTSRSDLWAVGNNGTILRFRGLSWSSVDSPTGNLLLDVWSASPTQAYIVGTQGTVLQWDGDDWTRMTVPNEANLFALWGRSSTELYTTGNTGAFWRFDGTRWQSIGVGSGHNMRAMAPSSVRTGGVRLAGWYNSIYQYTPGARAQVEKLDTWLLSAWRANTPNAPVYAVGLGGSVAQITASGLSWLDVPGTNDLYGISGSGPQDIVAVGDTGSILRFDGSTWRNEGDRSPIVWRSVWTAGPNQHFVVGQGGRIARSTASGWTPMPSGTQRFCAPCGG